MGPQEVGRRGATGVEAQRKYSVARLPGRSFASLPSQGARVTQLSNSVGGPCWEFCLEHTRDRSDCSLGVAWMSREPTDCVGARVRHSVDAAEPGVPERDESLSSSSIPANTTE